MRISALWNRPPRSYVDGAGDEDENGLSPDVLSAADAATQQDPDPNNVNPDTPSAQPVPPDLNNLPQLTGSAYDLPQVAQPNVGAPTAPVQQVKPSFLSRVGAGIQKNVKANGGWGSVLSDALLAGVTAGGTPNVAHGGGTDLLRGIAAGRTAVENHEQSAYDRKRQEAIDKQTAALHQAQMENYAAQARLRDARAGGMDTPDRYMSAGGGKIFDTRQGAWVPAPQAQGPPSDTLSGDGLAKFQGQYRGQIVPDAAQMNIPAPQGTPYPFAMQETVPVPPPNGYTPVAGTSGDQRMVIPTAEHRAEMDHPPTTKYAEGPTGDMTAIVRAPGGGYVKTDLGQIGKGFKPPAGRTAAGAKGTTPAQFAAIEKAKNAQMISAKNNATRRSDALNKSTYSTPAQKQAVWDDYNQQMKQIQSSYEQGIRTLGGTTAKPTDPLGLR